MSKKVELNSFLQKGEYKMLFDSLDVILGEDNHYNTVKRGITHSLAQAQAPNFYQIQAIEMLIQNVELKEHQAISPSEELNEQLKKANADLEDAKRLYVLRERVREELFEKTDREIAQHYPEIIFYRLYTSEKLSSHELGDLHNFIEDKNIGWQRKIMVVASITISLLRKFDADRLNLLVDFVNKYEEEVWQRAFTGLVLALENVPIATFEMYHPDLYRKIHFLQQNDYIETAYQELTTLLKDNVYRLEMEANEFIDFINTFLKEDIQLSFDEKHLLVNNLNAILPLVIENNKVVFAKLLGLQIADIPFFQSNKLHHWFLGVDMKSPLIMETVWQSGKNIDNKFIPLLKGLPVGTIMQHTVVFQLKKTMEASLQLSQKIIPLLYEHIDETEREVAFPILSFLNDLYLFQQFYPSEEKEKLLKENINLFDTPLMEIFLNEYTRKRLLADVYFERALAESSSINKIALYEQTIALNPQKHEAWYNLGLTYRKEENYEEAKKCYLKAIEIKGDKHEAWNNLGNVYDNEENNEEAKKCYQKAIDIKADYHEAWYNLGLTYRKEENYVEAKKCYLKAVGIKLDYHEVWNNLGNAYSNEENYVEAKKCYLKAVGIKGDHHGIWYNLGLVYAKEGNYIEAKKCFQKAINIKEDYHEAWNNLGIVYAKEGNYKEAKKCYIKAISIKPDKEEAIFNLACAYCLEKDKANALKYLAEAIRLNNKNKQDAPKDTDFEWLWEDADFLALVR